MSRFKELKKEYDLLVEQYDKLQRRLALNPPEMTEREIALRLNEADLAAAKDLWRAKKEYVDNLKYIYAKLIQKECEKQEKD